MLMMKMMLRPMSPEEAWGPDEVDEDDDDEGPMNLLLMMTFIPRHRSQPRELRCLAASLVQPLATVAVLRSRTRGFRVAVRK